MVLNLTKLKVGQPYDRPFLAKEWGYESYQGISRGIVTPQNSNNVILFVTKGKQESLTQYNDYLDGDLLFWEGALKHGSDLRIINSSKTNESIFLFYREKHHSPFIFYGQIILVEFQIHKDRPSEFIFQVGSLPHPRDILEDLDYHKEGYKILAKTEQQAIIKSRIGQGLFRAGVIHLWGNCSVTGVTNLSILKASHIKPWGISSNSDRLNPYNGLLLIPNLDSLFDIGFISFINSGEIIISKELSNTDREILGISSSLKLRTIFPENIPFLEFHRSEKYIK